MIQIFCYCGWFGSILRLMRGSCDLIYLRSILVLSVGVGTDSLQTGAFFVSFFHERENRLRPWHSLFILPSDVDRSFVRVGVRLYGSRRAASVKNVCEFTVSVCLYLCVCLSVSVCPWGALSPLYVEPTLQAFGPSLRPFP